MSWSRLIDSKTKRLNIDMVKQALNQILPLRKMTHLGRLLTPKFDFPFFYCVNVGSRELQEVQPLNSMFSKNCVLQ